MIAQQRVKIFRKLPNGSVEDSGWEEVQYDNVGAGYEPADLVLNRGFNGPTKQITSIRIENDNYLRGGSSLVGGCVGNLRTGTAAV